MDRDCNKKSKPITIGFIYRNPCENTSWIKRYHSMMKAVTFEDREAIILGDFNIDLLKAHTNWKSTYKQYCQTQIIKTPTRITTNSQTLIDHIYVTNREHIVEFSSPSFGLSDHNAICVTWAKKGIKTPKAGHKTICFRNFAKFDQNSFLLDLMNAQLSEVYQHKDPDTALNLWLVIFNKVYNKHAPFMTKRVQDKPKPPWWSKEIDEAIHCRNSLKEQKKIDEYKLQRNKVTTLKRSSKKKYFQKLATSNSDSKSIWKAINTLTNKTPRNPRVTMKNLSAEELNDHFVNVASKVIVNDKSKDNDLSQLKTFCHDKKIHHAAYIPKMKLHEVYDALRELKQTGTKGLDGIDGKILKSSAPVIAESLMYIYNLCIDNNYFPAAFKEAKVIPIYKSDDPSDPSNFRPISVLPVLSKPLERHMLTHISKHITKYKLIHPNQSGFRENHSCHTALTNMVEQFLTNIKDGQLSGVLFMDFAKAFDVIDHNLLIRKLKCYNISHDTLIMIQSFLTNRRQLVQIDTKQSSFRLQKYGVPQGSILGPLLFTLYINDLPLSIDNGLCELFADDTTTHASHRDIHCVSKQLQENVNKMTKWTEFNHMALNPKKNKSMLVTTPQKRRTLTTGLPPIYIANDKVEEVDSHTVLGITIDKNLTWSIYLHSLSERVSQKIRQLSQMKHFLTQHARKIFFHAHIQSIIDYASTLWDNASASALKPLTRQHKRAIKQILLRTTSITANDYRTLGILPLKQKLVLNKACLMFKIVNNIAPQALADKFPKNENRNNHNDRKVCSKPNVNYYKTSLQFSGGTLWNSLPEHMRHINSLSSFKHAYKDHLFTTI